MEKKSRLSQKRGNKGLELAAPTIDIDAYRALVFPNRIRKFRKQLNIGSLLELSETIPNITYIRLSKIERGEIFARSDEIVAIAKALNITPLELLIDIDDPQFDIAEWAEPFLGNDRANSEAERFAVYLAAAMRLRRTSDDTLTISILEQKYKIAPVMLSRIENALKPLERWNEDVRQSLRRLFEVESDAALIEHVNAMYDRGELDMILPLIANPQLRIKKSRTRIAALRDELEKRQSAPPSGKQSNKAATKSPKPDNTLLITPAPNTAAIAENRKASVNTKQSANLPPAQNQDGNEIRKILVFGIPMADGLIDKSPVGSLIEAPRKAGPRAYGLRMCRPTLGAALPGKSTLIVDPDVFPSAGGLAVISSDHGLRVVSVTFDRHGKMLGYSQNPDIEVVIDDLDPSNIATVIAAFFE